ncbi:MAG: cytochrome c [Pseudomonadota bacterium]
MKSSNTLRYLLAIVAVAGASTLAYAHSGATGAVKTRMDTMKSIADDMKAISTTLRNKELRYGLIGAAANRIEGHSARVPAEFREKDLSKPTEAIALIWDQFDDFTRQSRDMEIAARALERAALDGAKPEVILARFKTLGDTCGACHRDYRVRN